MSIFRKVIVSLSIVSAVTAGVTAFSFDFVTVSDIVKKVKDKYSKIECYTAEFTITSEKAGKKTTQRGVVKSKFPDKLLVEFSSPSGQRIVTSNRTMWIYMPSLNVVAQQDLSTGDSVSSSFFSSGTKKGLDRLFSKYHYKFDSKDQPSKADDGKMYYTVSLKQKESRSGFRTMKLWISEDFLIRRALGETASGKVVDITFTNINTSVDLPNGIFKFDAPPMARVIKNPMMAEE